MPKVKQLWKGDLFISPVLTRVRKALRLCRCELKGKGKKGRGKTVAVTQMMAVGKVRAGNKAWLARLTELRSRELGWGRGRRVLAISILWLWAHLHFFFSSNRRRFHNALNTYTHIHTQCRGSYYKI